ncbi:MAG TPA: hypothetical protein VGC63_08600 [Solirubrobacterales bacterium]|jgi:hypothetical protein
MSKSVTAFSAALMAVTLILAGCGSGNESTAKQGSDSASKADFVREADSVCANGGKQTESEYAAYIKENKITSKTGLTTAQFAAIRSEILVPALRRQLGELRALEVPAGEGDEVNAYLDAVEEGLKKVEEADPKTAVESTPTLLVNADRLANEYGFKVCGRH